MLDSLDTLIAFVLIMLVVSMLITICVQMLSALFNLRGKYLAQGLTHTFKTISPALADKAETLACRILSGRLLSDSRMQKLGRCATAVRPDEVFDALHRVATGRTDAVPALRKNVRDLLRGLGVSEVFLSRAEAEAAAVSGSVRETAGALTDAARDALAQLPQKQQAAIQATLDGMANRIKAYEATAAQTVAEDAAAVARAMDDAFKKFKYWFEVSQERAQQWFTTHTRWFTIGLAFAFAFWLQLDTVEIFKLVSSNRAVRDALVAQVDVVSKQADKVLNQWEGTLARALTSWRAGLTNEAAKTAVADLTVAPTESRDAFREKLRARLAAAGIQEADALLGTFDAALTRQVQEDRQKLEQDFRDVGGLVNNTGFSLFPPPGAGRWGKQRWDHFWDHFVGMVFSAGLLSLGAPFWFNALKSLANLRSRVAQNISNEQEGDKKPPGASPSRAAAPPTVAPA
ncbi:MAG TPA: hypothetical protein VM940_05185 [Chthoniobacterales bacterium]|jgi:hypothetical protein|nr:hypothetical protein [Chthoniobacterales bacterium]